MRMVGTFEAKTYLSELLRDIAERKETITITKQGRPVAILGPVPETKEREMTPMEAWEKLRELRKGFPKVNWEEIKEWIEEGRV